jgi:hypothetical protein
VKITVVILAVIVAALTAATTVQLVTVADWRHQQQQRQAAQAKLLATDDHEISALQNSVATLIGQVSNPVDSLSAYTDICNVQSQNDATGITQTYYYPCTNQAQTTPQPGN